MTGLFHHQVPDRTSLKYLSVTAQNQKHTLTQHRPATQPAIRAVRPATGTGHSNPSAPPITQHAGAVPAGEPGIDLLADRSWRTELNFDGAVRREALVKPGEDGVQSRVVGWDAVARP